MPSSASRRERMQSARLPRWHCSLQRAAGPRRYQVGAPPGLPAHPPARREARSPRAAARSRMRKRIHLSERRSRARKRRELRGSVQAVTEKCRAESGRARHQVPRPHRRRGAPGSMPAPFRRRSRFHSTALSDDPVLAGRCSHPRVAPAGSVARIPGRRRTPAPGPCLP